MSASPVMPLQKLQEAVAHDKVRTVLVAAAGQCGRLRGVRVDAHVLLNRVAQDGIVVPKSTLGGTSNELINATTGEVGDVVLRPDLETARPVTWLPATALVLCDVVGVDGLPVASDPRQVLLKQLARLRASGYSIRGAVEIEFVLFSADQQASAPQVATSVEPFLRDIHTHLNRMGMQIRTIVSGTGALGSVPSPSYLCESRPHHLRLLRGQFTVTLEPNQALLAADQQVLFRYAVTELATVHGLDASFMASCAEHISSGAHLQHTVVNQSDHPVFPALGADMSELSGQSALFDTWTAGLLTTMREFSVLYAPSINSYKRYLPGRLGSATVAWGFDNRTCALRVLRHGAGMRLENRVPGSDVNPYLAWAATIAGGLWGLEAELALEPELVGNAHMMHRSRLPVTLGEARDLFNTSVLARNAFGDDVVDHYVQLVDAELSSFHAAVTDWEWCRGVESY